MKRLTAITGGIGSGKSVVSRILEAKGWPVYDCDARAKAIMDSDAAIHRRLTAEIHPLAVVDGVIDRRLIASVVFADPEALGRLNAIVHRAVTADLLAWAAERPVAFVETAILYESGLRAHVTDVWEVTAPAELRIERVMARSGLERSEVERRMAAQAAPSLPDHRVIVNDGRSPLLPQVERLLVELG